MNHEVSHPCDKWKLYNCSSAILLKGLIFVCLFLRFVFSVRQQLLHCVTTAMPIKVSSSFINTIRISNSVHCKNSSILIYINLHQQWQWRACTKVVTWLFNFRYAHGVSPGPAGSTCSVSDPAGTPVPSCTRSSRNTEVTAPSVIKFHFLFFFIHVKA